MLITCNENYNLKVIFSVQWILIRLLGFSVNEKMSKGAIKKALFESAALIMASGLQVYVLRRLFERKLGASRV